MTEQIEESQLSTDMTSELYFDHWMCDGLCTELLAKDRGLRGLLYDRPLRLHDGYRDLLNILGDRIRSAIVNRLCVIDDRGINAHRTGRLRRLRTLLKCAINGLATGHRNVFITPGAGGELRTSWKHCRHWDSA